jgi:signal transduction histidine kinase
LERKVEERTHDLERANQKLIQTEKYAATGRLAANLAHEINNPLGIIKNYLRLVRTKMENGEGGRRATDPNLDHMGIIDEEIGRIARIVRQLLDLHRPPEQEVKRTDVGALLSDLVALMEPDLTKSGIEVKCELDPDLPRIMVAPDLIRQVFINLLRNAQDAMEKGGTLTVRAEARPKSDGREAAIVVTVADTGTGIEEGDMGRIFDPFFSTKAPEKGTGLGLAVSYSIVRVYQGSIDVRSEPGNGTTMTVTLPVEAKAEVNPA